MAALVEVKPAHSDRGASSSKRWMTCRGSVRLCRQVPPSAGSFYATQGTAAHGLSEFCLWPLVHMNCKPKRAKDARAEFVKDNPKWAEYVDDEMVEAVQVYVDYVWNTFGAGIMRGELRVSMESRLSLESLAPECAGMFGTADLVIVDERNGRVWVIDYKHGAGVVVEVEGNTQTLYYALAVTLSLKTPVSSVTSVIVQPRGLHGEPIREATADMVDMVEFTAELLDAARATMEPDAPLVSGSHCRFCPAAALCPRLAEDNLNAARAEFGVSTAGERATLRVPPSPEILTPEQLAAILSARPLVEAWLEECGKFAQAQLEAGNDATAGEFKLVAKRATRKWAQPDEQTADMLCTAFGLGDDDVFKTSLRTPADIEKKLPKDKRAMLESLVVKESSGTTLAPASDPRPAVSLANPALEFGSIAD